MAKKIGRKGGAVQPGGNVKWYLAALVVVTLGGMGLYLGSGITLTPRKVTISPPPSKEAAQISPTVEQKATATGEDARAANAAGDINKGKKAADAGAPVSDKVASKEVRQEATATGKNSSALNAGGNLNVE